MAYRAEIEIGVKGQQSLKKLQDRVQDLAFRADALQEIFDNLVPNKAIQSVKNYTNTLREAERALSAVEAGGKDEIEVIRAYVRAAGEAASIRDRQTSLIEQEARSLGLLTEQLRAYNAAAVPPRKAGGSLVGRYLRPGSAVSQTQTQSPFGPGPGIQFGSTTQFGPVGGPSSSVLGGQSSIVEGRLQRITAIKKDELTLEKALLDLEKKSAAQLNEKLRLQEGLVAGTREVLELAQRARQEQAFKAGVSGEAVAGPLAGPGSLGFPVALPGLSEAESKGLRIAKEKLQIINRTVQRRKELGGLAANLQRLDNKAKVAIADASRDQAKLNDFKQEQLELEKLINKEQVKRSIARRRRIVENAKEVRRRRQDAISSGIIGGAFPLLFGQGAGAAVGGGVGGAAGGLLGGQFGFGLSLVGTQLGTIFDTLVTKAGNLANSLKTTGEIISGLEEAGFKVSDATKSVISSYEEAGLLSDAYALALEEVNRVLGPDGVAKLDAYKTETERLNAEFEKVSATLQSELLPALTGVIRIILGAKAAFDEFAQSPLGQIFLKGATETALNLVPGLRGATQAVDLLQRVGAPSGDVEKPTAQRLAEEDAEIDRLTTQQNLNKAAREERIIVAARLQLAQAGNDLTKEAVVAARKNLIQETYLAAVRKEGLTDQERLLAEDNKKLALAQLKNSVQEAINRKNKQQNGKGELNRLERQAKVANDLLTKLDQQNAILEVAGSTEARRLQIQFQYENTLARISQLENQDYALEQQRLALANRNLQLSQLEAQAEAKALESIRAAVAPIEAIRRGQEQRVQTTQDYFRLIAEGVLPSEAERLANFNEQIRVSLLLLEAEELRLRTAGLTQEALQEQLDIIERQRKAIEGAASQGPGAAEPEATPQQIIQERIGKVKEELEAMANLGNVAVQVADSIGGAFSTAFTQVVSGSKSAQQALSDAFKSIAADFLKMAADIIAKQLIMITLQTILKALGGAGGGGEGPNVDLIEQYSNVGANTPVSPFAEGGYVSGPTRALVGEGGESEYIIPESKMRESMARYSRGARGGAVIPETGESGTSGEGGGTAVAEPIDVRYSVERINNVDYVTAEQFQAGLARAAQQGAAQGEQRTLRRLKMSPSSRRGVGF